MTETLQRETVYAPIEHARINGEIETTIREKIARHPGKATEQEILTALEQGWLYGINQTQFNEREVRAIAHAICAQEAATLALTVDELRYDELDFDKLGNDFTPVLDAVSLSALAGIRYARRIQQQLDASDPEITTV